jgi:hypothetical protein
MENNKLQENLTETNLKHNHKMMSAMKEVLLWTSYVAHIDYLHRALS